MPHTLSPGQSFRIVGVSEQDGQLDIDRDGLRVAVYAWPGSTLRVYCGDQLVDDFSTKFPDLPPGMSTKSFISFMFGGPGEPHTKAAECSTSPRPGFWHGVSAWCRRLTQRCI